MNNLAIKVISVFSIIILLAIGSLKILGSNYFPVEEISISGNKRISSNEIVKRTGIRAGVSSMFFFESKSKKALIKNPWVSEAEIIKDFPGKIIIKIKEKEPFCLFTEDGQNFIYLSEKGEMLGKQNKKDGLDFPIVKLEGTFNQSLIDDAVQLLRLSRSSNILSWDNISEVGINPKYGLKVLTTDKRHIDFGLGNISSKWFKVEKIISHSRTINLTEQYINISSEKIGIVDFGIL